MSLSPVHTSAKAQQFPYENTFKFTRPGSLFGSAHFLFVFLFVTVHVLQESSFWTGRQSVSGKRSCSAWHQACLQKLIDFTEATVSTERWCRGSVFRQNNKEGKPAKSCNGSNFDTKPSSSTMFWQIKHMQVHIPVRTQTESRVTSDVPVHNAHKLYFISVFLFLL